VLIEEVEMVELFCCDLESFVDALDAELL
jgi:hypothetical protein